MLCGSHCFSGISDNSLYPCGFTTLSERLFSASSTLLSVGGETEIPDTLLTKALSFRNPWQFSLRIILQQTKPMKYATTNTPDATLNVCQYSTKVIYRSTCRSVCMFVTVLLLNGHSVCVSLHVCLFIGHPLARYACLQVFYCVLGTSYPFSCLFLGHPVARCAYL